MVEDPVPALPTSDEDSGLMEDPRLPVELECLIFELAFDRDDPRSNARMALVARRVYSWLMPIMYRVFVQVWGRPLYPDLEKVQATGSLSKICQLARYMIIDDVDRFDRSEVMADLLDKCHNLEDLSCWLGLPLGGNPTWSTLSKLRHLRRLCGSFHHITNHQLGEAAFAPNLTHLLLMRFNRQWRRNVESGLFAVLPNLTHFGITWGINDLNVEGLARELKLCTHLRVFIYRTKVINAGRFQDMFAMEPRMAIFDRELHSCSAWISGTRGEPDVWSLAEGVVFARQRTSSSCPWFGSRLMITLYVQWHQRDTLTPTSLKNYLSLMTSPGETTSQQRELSGTRQMSIDFLEGTGLVKDLLVIPKFTHAFHKEY